MQNIFLSRNNIIMGLCQMLLLHLCFDIYSDLNEKKHPDISMWSDLSIYSDWFNQQSLMALVTGLSCSFPISNGYWGADIAYQDTTATLIPTVILSYFLKSIMSYPFKNWKRTAYDLYTPFLAKEKQSLQVICLLHILMHPILREGQSSIEVG